MATNRELGEMVAGKVIGLVVSSATRLVVAELSTAGKATV